MKNRNATAVRCNGLLALNRRRETGRFQQPDRIVVAGCFSAEGKQVAAAAVHFLCIWDAASGKQVRTLPMSFGDWRSYPRAAFHPSGKYLAAGGGDGAIRLSEAQARAILAENAKGVGVVQGHMVDEAVARKARRILIAAGEPVPGSNTSH